MEEFTHNLWMPCGETGGGFEYIPQDGTEFMIMHPNWVCPAFVAMDSSTGRVVFVDPDLGSENDIDYIVDFSDMWFYIPTDLPEEFYERNTDV